MAGQTKMIIITSNEDLIQQLLTNKTTNTKIIDFDHDKQVAAMASDDNNVINLSFLAELSELNSKSDQIFKRALDLPDHNRSKQMKPSKKKVDLICGICGDRAIGFNYDAPSCASCKAFFRRNAYQPPEKIQCLTGQGQCSVAHETRRKCPRCRLDRCLGAGMRKDFFVSKEVAQQKKDRLEENRNNSSTRSSTQSLSNSESLSETLDEIDRLVADIGQADGDTLLRESTILNEIEDGSLETLCLEDWITIQNVRSSALSIFHKYNQPAFVLDVSDRTSALISWSHKGSQFAELLITFFRQIDEFENLHGDDRFILIKYNLHSLMPITKSFYFNPKNDGCSHADNQNPGNHNRFFILFDDSYGGIHEIFTNLMLRLAEATGQDATLLSLLLVVLIFSRGLSMDEEEPLLNDSLAVHRAQCYYTKVLWNYLISKEREVQACRHFTQLIALIFRMQSASKASRDFFRRQFMISNAVDKIAPLMQAVMHIA